MSKNGLQLASDLKYYLDYSRWIEDENRSETWDDSVNRVMNMHKVKYAKYLSNPRFMELFNEADKAYKEKLVLGSQRALQFGGDPILNKNARMYNCAAVYVNRVRVFQEVMHQLLCGTGVGVSVQYRHISKLPMIGKREKGVKTFVVPDSIEGWSDAFGILISSYVSEEGKSSFPEYEGYEIRFDLSLIRPEGSMISGGFKAPGPEGLRRSLIKCEELMEKNVNQNITFIKPIIAYDYIMHMADAVLSGGLRRSAIICLFSPDDDELMNAKIGNWFYDNPQRARSNNSAVINRNDATREEFAKIFKSIKEFGEPGFYFVDDNDQATNPCVTGDVLVNTDKGEIKMVELVGRFTDGEKFNALSYSEEKNIFEFKEITNAALTRKNTAILKFEFKTDDKTYVIKCTPDHKILTTEGYVEAKDISYDDDIITSTGKAKLYACYYFEPNENVYDITVKDNHNFLGNNIVVHNCVEIGLYPQIEIDGKTEYGWQMCNLSEGNGSACTTEDKFYDACRSLSILGTLQAGYTEFPYLGDITEQIMRREALLGCSFTGWMSNPHVMMNPEIQRRGAEIVKEVNKELSEIIEINPASRTTTTKPGGNSSVILRSPSGCHGDHSPKYFRCMQINKFSEIGKYLEKEHPYLIEESVWSANKTDHVAFIPIVANKNAKFKKDLIGLKQLEVVKTLQNNWVEYGTNHERNVKPFLRHSVSNTVELDYNDYDMVEEYLFENRYDFAAVSFLPLTGDKDYNQAPFTSVLTSEELLEKYGDASLFASGLIVDGLHAFDGNLWEACDYVFKRDLTLQGTRVQALIKKDWIRRAKQFAKRFFKGDIKEMILCLKDIHLYHKWVRINRELKQRDFDFDVAIKKPEYVNMDTMGAISCSGPNGSCDIDPNIMAAMRSSVS